MSEIFDLRKVMENIAPADGSGRTFFRNSMDLETALKDGIQKIYPKASIEMESGYKGRYFDILVKLDRAVFPIECQCRVADVSFEEVDGKLVAKDTGTNTSTAQTITRSYFWKKNYIIEQYFKENKNLFGSGYILLVTNKSNYLNYFKNGIPISDISPSDLVWTEIKSNTGVSFYYLCYEVRGREIPGGLISPSQGITNISNVGKLLGKFKSRNDRCLFRGQVGLKYLLLPNGLRSKNTVDYEKKVFTDVITQHPESYLPLSNLERLSKMQHGEIPTRMLDVTRNPLVGLFFAVSSLHDEKYDELHEKSEIEEATKLIKNRYREIKKRCETSWLMCMTPESIKDFNSDCCRVLSALPYLSSEEQLQLRYEAVMDYLIQRYANIVVQQTSNRGLSRSEKAIMKDIIRLYLYGVLDYVKIIESSNGKHRTSLYRGFADELIKDVRKKLMIKYRGFTDDIQLLLSRVPFEKKSPNSVSVCGYVFQYECLSSLVKRAAFENPFVIIVPDSKIDIRDVMYVNEDELSSMRPFLINPESGEYFSSILCKLHSKIMLECPSFNMKLSPLDILNGVFVSPVVNTPRMIAQQGLFMLYGLSDFWNVNYFMTYMNSENVSYHNILEYVIYNDDSFLCMKSDDGNVIINEIRDEDKLIDFFRSVYKAELYRITKQSKIKLRKELKFLGVDKATMGRSEITTAYEVK